MFKAGALERDEARHAQLGMSQRHRLRSIIVLLGATGTTLLLSACGSSSLAGGPAATPPGAATSSSTADPCSTPPTPTSSPGGDSFCTAVASLTFLPGGLQYADLAVGNGRTLRDGDSVRVEYTGWLQATGAMFDSSRLPGRQPFVFTLGAHSVIAGWEQGLVGMHVGGKRRLVIPSSLAYGAQGRPPTIPPNSALVFDVEVLPSS